MILEAILSTLGKDGKTHLAPIGVILPDNKQDPEGIGELSFKLYAGSCTYDNLLALGEGVANLTDDVMYFVDALYRKNGKTSPPAKVKPQREATTAASSTTPLARQSPLNPV